jgi:hypothetical protein
MLHAPVSENKTQDKQTKTQSEPESERRALGWAGYPALGLGGEYGATAGNQRAQGWQLINLSTLSQGGVLQRKCACSSSAGSAGTCSECQSREGRMLQTKLSIGASDDKYEREADRVADEVMRMPESTIQPNVGLEQKGGIQRKAISNSITPLQRSSTDSSQSAEVPGTVHDVLRSSGQPLDRATRALMETRFGRDFSQVRIHTGGDADRSARDINARAYTVGNNIVFGASQFSQRTHEGQRLLAHELTHVVQQRSANPKIQRDPTCKPETSTSLETQKVVFVYTEGLNLRLAANQTSTSLARLKFGQRVHTLVDPISQPGWRKVAVLGKIGYVFEAHIHCPPESLIQKDPGLSLIKVKPGETFWGLVKNVYGIQGNESTKDQNINHFINVIRAVNDAKAFKSSPKKDVFDDIGNSFISGRDATDTDLIAGVNLWIPSFGVAAKMDVGSGTVRGEVTRLVKKIEQKIQDFQTACSLAGKFIPSAITKSVGNTVEGLLTGLIEFAKDAAIILGGSTAVGALIGSLFGGVGAIPGAEIGFEVGLLILKIYGLYMLVEAIIGVAGNLLSQLGQFIQLVWTADGDKKKLEQAAQSLADALGTLVAAVLMVLAAYLLKKRGEAFSKTKFAKTVGETRLMEWLKKRQQFETSKENIPKKTNPEGKSEVPKVQDLEIEGGKKVLAEKPTADGRHKIKVTREGIRRCSPSCPLLIQTIDIAIHENPKLKEKLEPLRKELESAQGKVEEARLAQDRATNPQKAAESAVQETKAAKEAAEVSARVSPKIDKIIKDSPLSSGLRGNEYRTPELAIGKLEGKAKLVGKDPITNPKLIEDGYIDREYYRDLGGTKWSIDVRNVDGRRVYKQGKRSSGQDID